MCIRECLDDCFSAPRMYPPACKNPILIRYVWREGEPPIPFGETPKEKD